MNTARKRFTEQEDNLLRIYWKESKNELPKYFPYRTYRSLQNRASHLGLRIDCRKTTITRPELPPTMLGYFAGHFDGEGCIRMRRQGRLYALRVESVGNCQKTIQMYQAYFGGQVRSHKGVNKTLYYWSLSSYSDCLYFLTLLMPHLIEKESQAESAIQWLSWRVQYPHRYNYSTSDLEFSESTFQTIKSLKQ